MRAKQIVWENITESQPFIIITNNKNEEGVLEWDLYLNFQSILL